MAYSHKESALTFHCVNANGFLG
ncbi:hypothetical protein CY0110_17817 [Crocosphaera chwakensis CCY0110]|uniref:Uncharacterized protein n=1 Tax=Crocosphaera chwakensis CCY0110 TaxID=391612 RepID=A3IIP5_9CHRO|nr:hypothetical protein CY0110_17817 [Crocosphaera chwakensis CCY0110]